MSCSGPLDEISTNILWFTCCVYCEGINPKNWLNFKLCFSFEIRYNFVAKYPSTEKNVCKMGINFNIVLCSGALLRYKYGGNESKLNKFGNKGRAHHYTLTEENMSMYQD